MPVDLFLQLQWAYVQSNHMSSRERARHKLDNTDFPHLAVITAKCSTCPQQRLTLSLRYDILPRATSQPSSGTMVSLVSFYYGGITRSDTYSGYWFAFLVSKAPVRTTLSGLRECLIHNHWVLHSIASDQGTSVAKEVQNWACIHRMHWSILVPHCVE